MRANWFSAPICAAFLLTGCPAQEKPASSQTSQAQQAKTPAPAPKTPASQPAQGAASQPAHGAASQPAAGHGNLPAQAPFTGLIKLADGVDAKPAEGNVLFIMARGVAPDGQAGQLIAVKKESKLEFPMRYEISASDLMVKGVPFAGPFMVNARLDRDSNPMTKGPDDLVGEFAGPVSGGQSNVNITLSPIAQGAASQPAQAAPKKPASQPK